MCRERDITDVDKLNEQGKVSSDTIKKLPTYHAVIFMRNETGRINLYKLVSKSHIKYFNHRPRVPKSVFEAHREGLLIGSACEAGELYQALLRNAPEQEIARLVSFYDYLEIQPLGNNMFMVEDEKNDTIHSKEDLIEINKKIVKLGEQFNKPVVATCDVHFMDPQTKSTAVLSWLEAASRMLTIRHLFIFALLRKCWRSFLIWEVRRQRKW